MIILSILIVLFVILLTKFNILNKGEFKELNYKRITDTSTSTFNEYFITYDTNTNLIYLNGNNSSLCPLYSYTENGQIHVKTLDEYKKEKDNYNKRFTAVNDNIKYTIGPKKESLYVTYDTLTNIVYLKTGDILTPFFNENGLPMNVEEFNNSKKNFAERFKVLSEKYNDLSGQYNYKDIGTAYYDISTEIVYILSNNNLFAPINSNGKAINAKEFSGANSKDRFKILHNKYNDKCIYCDDITNVVYLKEQHYIVPLYGKNSKIMTVQDISQY